MGEGARNRSTDALGVASNPTVRPIHYLGNKTRVLDAIEAGLEAVAGREGRVCDLFSGSGVVAGALVQHRPVLAADIQAYSRVLSTALMHPLDLTGRADSLIASASERLSQITAGSLSSLLSLESDAAEQAAEGDASVFCDLVENGSIRAGVHMGSSPPVQAALERAAEDAGLRVATVTSYYGGVYFSYRQAAEIDALASTIAEFDPRSKDVALAALISTASELVATVGSHFAQPPRLRTSRGATKAAAVRTTLRRRALSAFDVFARWLKTYSSLDMPPFDGSSVQADYRAVLRDLPDDVVAVYADPPYTRDHYSRFYHVLETLALGDDPGLSTVAGSAGETPSRGLYRRDRHQSPFCIARQVDGAFDALFSGAAEKAVPLVLSYSPLSEGTAARPRTRLMTIDGICTLAAAHFANVSVETAGRIAHSKLNAKHLNAAVSYDAEVLVLCTP